MIFLKIYGSSMSMKNHPMSIPKKTVCIEHKNAFHAERSPIMAKHLENDMPDLKIENLEISSLKPWANNARTHSKKQIKQIANSIKEFGFTNPVLIDDENNILAGHGRVAAAKTLNMQAVPCVYLSHMTPVQKRAYVLADNKLALNAGWDDELLAEELEALHAIDIDFDLEHTGFSIAEADLIIESLSPEDDSDPDDDLIPIIDDTLPEVQLGDIWELGPHRLICADALNEQTLILLMEDKRAHMVFTDPPYNVPIDGNVCGKGSIKHDEFEMASGEMSLKWPPVKCQRINLPSSCVSRLRTWQHIAKMVQFILFAWTGATFLKSAKLANMFIQS